MLEFEVVLPRELENRVKDVCRLNGYPIRSVACRNRHTETLTMIIGAPYRHDLFNALAMVGDVEDRTRHILHVTKPKRTETAVRPPVRWVFLFDPDDADLYEIFSMEVEGATSDGNGRIVLDPPYFADETLADIRESLRKWGYRLNKRWCEGSGSHEWNVHGTD